MAAETVEKPKTSFFLTHKLLILQHLNFLKSQYLDFFDSLAIFVAFFKTQKPGV
jgi:hypothetical protein